MYLDLDDLIESLTPRVARCRYFEGWDWFWCAGQSINENSDKWIEVVW